MDVEIADRQSILPFAADRLRTAAERILAEADYTQGSLSIAVVEDGEMQALNKQYLEHDYPTDVLSFLLDEDGDRLEGQLIVSIETAQRTAPEYGWGVEEELLYYVIHGTLHLVGHDDHEPADIEAMRAAERAHLAHFDLTLPAAHDSSPGTQP